MPTDACKDSQKSIVLRVTNGASGQRIVASQFLIVQISRQFRDCSNLPAAAVSHRAANEVKAGSPASDKEPDDLLPLLLLLPPADGAAGGGCCGRPF